LPYFTLQFSQGAPIVTAFVGVSLARRNALTASHQPVPQPQQIIALIDTGASGTCVDPSVLQALGLSPTGIVPVCTPTTGTAPQNMPQFDILLLIPGASASHVPLVVPTLAVLGSALHVAQGIHALIGRDVLSRCLMTYDGTSGFFSIAY
jgi:hypothetical protein